MSNNLLALVACVALLSSSVQAFVVPSHLGISPASGSSSTELYIRRGGGRPRQRGRVVQPEKPPMNGQLPDSELRVVIASTTGGKDEPVGLLSKAEALAKAKELGGLDVILVNNNSVPPVCKIVDYSKYRYMKEKKAKEVKKNSKATEIKEVKMSYKIDVHDYQVRKRNAEKFLKQGNRVKCTVMFRGREMQHDKLGFELLDKLALELEDMALREGKAKREGRQLTSILSPRPEVLKARADAKRAEEKAKRKKREKSLEERNEALKSEELVQEEAKVAAATAVAEAEAKQDDLLSALSMNEDDDDDEDDSVESSLDALLGSDDLTDDLFS